MLKKIAKANIVAKRWFEKVNGNTYHSITIELEDAHGVKETLRAPFVYGYGNHYKQTAQEMLFNAGYDVPEKYGDFMKWVNSSEDITITCEDVKRKKDL